MSSGPQATKRRLTSWPRSARRLIINGAYASSRTCSIPGDPFIFVIGDAARALDDKGHTLPALAPVAIQQGRYVARLLGDRTAPASRAPFVYKDRGILATIGKAHAVAQIGPFRTVGLLAWLLWSVVHIFFLIGFRNRLRVMFEWIWYLCHAASRLPADYRQEW